MAQPILTPHESVAAAPSAGAARTAIVWGGAGLASLAVVGALALWAHYGTAVFFETIRAGFTACFG